MWPGLDGATLVNLVQPFPPIYEEGATTAPVIVIDDEISLPIG
jgi:hypothetical protein